MSDNPEASQEPSENDSAAGAPEHLDGARPLESIPVLRPSVERGRPRGLSLPGSLNLRTAIALLCLAAGTLAAILGARALASSDAASARSSFDRSAAGVAATARLAVANEEAALAGAATYLSQNPHGTAGEFKAWARWARLLRNHPELESLSLVSLVRPAEVASFGARAATDGASSPTLPASSRPYRCLSLGSVAQGAVGLTSAAADLCSRRPGLPATRDNTQTRFFAAGADLQSFVPVYRGGATPKSLLGRRAAFAGWLRPVISPQAFMREALSIHPGYAGRLTHSTVRGSRQFALGSAAQGALSSTVRLGGGWSLQTLAASPSASVLDHSDAVALLIGGVLISVLLSLTVQLLGAAPAPAPTSERKALPEDLYDRLTELPNRGLTLDRAERMLARAGRQSGIMVGALIIDIDWFKDVNERLGEPAGDQLLKIVAERLEGVIRAHDTVGRYGDDEFVVLVESAAQGMRLDSLARRIIESLHKPVEIEGFGPSFCLTASIGVAFGRYATPADLLRDAQMALFAAKAAGKDRYTLFNANMRAIIEGRGVLEVELNTALQDEQLSVLYQPIFDLAAHRVVWLEALLRWEHPTKGEVPPADFIPLAEESGLIVPIGRWVLEEACTQAASWNVAGHRAGVAVKVSPAQLHRDGFATDVRRALQQSGLTPSLLALEIAETTVMLDKEAASRRMEELRQLGVRIAIDDFGSGYAYRSDLQRMPIDFLKVDRSSLAASEDESYRSWLLEAILVFGRDLSLTVIAKGVESQEQLGALQAMGCAMAQGYFMGEPTPAGSIESLFAVGPSPAPPAPSAPSAPSAPAPPVAPAGPVGELG
jgi:diguanylate cyclase (GGDEF)-like protein